MNPFDVPATADAIDTALELSATDRARRTKKLVRLATRTTPPDWLEVQLDAVG